MKLAATPPEVLKKPVGHMLVMPRSHSLDLFVREERIHLGDYPHPCPVDVFLPFWEVKPVLAVALLLNLGRKERLTFMHWINPQTALGVRVLNCLANDAPLSVSVVVEKVERTIRVPNVIKRHAKRLLKMISEREENWSEDMFARAAKYVDSLYPSPSRLLRICRKETRG